MAKGRGVYRWKETAGKEEGRRLLIVSIWNHICLGQTGTCLGDDVPRKIDELILYYVWIRDRISTGKPRPFLDSAESENRGQN